MADTTEPIAPNVRLPIAAVDFTLYQEATLNEYVAAVAQMFNATRLIAGTLLTSGAVTPANPVMQHLMAGAAGLESAVAIAQQQAQAQSRVVAPTLHMQPQRGRTQ